VQFVTIAGAADDGRAARPPSGASGASGTAGLSGNFRRHDGALELELGR
jgi:hypothetical protein